MLVKNPKELALNQKQITKGLNTLMGIVSGIVCDGHLHDTEIGYLSTWIKENQHLAAVYPASVVYRRIREVLQDGVITVEEKDYLLKELTVLSGTDFANTGSALPEHISTIFDDDPHIIVPENVFVFTGEFIYGTRSACNKAVESKGGITASTVTKSTNYLVVGSMASPDWIVANFGRKIQKAAEMMLSGDYEIAVVREQDWVMSI
jgi:NAD-dependent DNA ligase